MSTLLWGISLLMAVNPATTVRKLVSIPRDLAQEIDEFRHEARIGAESEAVRRLIRAGLAALKASAPAASKKFPR